MWFESGKDVKPHQGALAALRLAGDSLSSFPKCTDGKAILAAISKFDERSVSHAQLVAFDAAIKPMGLPTQKQLDARSPVTSRVLRAARSFIQAILAEQQGKEVRAWRCVASCALEAGLCMAVAFEHERKRTAGAAKTGSMGPLANALSHLVNRYPKNDAIFTYLSNIDSVSGDNDFPIEISDPIPDWKNPDDHFRYYRRGGTEDADGLAIKVSSLKKRISTLRSLGKKSAKATKRE